MNGGMRVRVASKKQQRDGAACKLMVPRMIEMLSGSASVMLLYSCSKRFPRLLLRTW